MTQKQLEVAVRTLEKIRVKEDQQVLSVFLSAGDDSSATAKSLVTQLHSLLHKHLNAEQRASLHGAIMRLESELVARPLARGTSLILYAFGGNVELVQLDVIIEPQLHLTNYLYLTPLKQLVNKSDSYAIVTVNRQRARILQVKNGEVIDSLEVVNPEPTRPAKTDHFDGVLGAQDKAFRHNQKYLLQYLQDVAQKADQFTKRHNLKQIVIAGRKDIIGKLKEYLPQTVRARVQGELMAVPDMATREILKRAEKAISDIRQHELA